MAYPAASWDVSCSTGTLGTHPKSIHCGGETIARCNVLVEKFFSRIFHLRRFGVCSPTVTQDAPEGERRWSWVQQCLALKRSLFLGVRWYVAYVRRESGM